MTEQVVLVLDDSGLVANAIVMGAGWTPPAGHRVVIPSDGAWVGWKLEGDAWIPPNPPET